MVSHHWSPPLSTTASMAPPSHSPRGATMASHHWSRELAHSRPSLPSSSSSSPPPQRPPLVLPLTLSYHNASQLASAQRGIGDGACPNARMHLHDDLLTNGYYMMRLYIGMPLQEFALIVDSRSTLTYVPCATYDQCGNHQPEDQSVTSATTEEAEVRTKNKPSGGGEGGGKFHASTVEETVD